MTTSAKSIIASFISDLSTKARYGLRGEKPLAVISILKYLNENNIAGKTLLELLAEPHEKYIRRIYARLANEIGSIKEPLTSWDLLVRKTRELKDTTLQFKYGDVNDAFSKLDTGEIEQMNNNYSKYL